VNGTAQSYGTPDWAKAGFIVHGKIGHAGLPHLIHRLSLA
jgi:hypothetical protein